MPFCPECRCEYDDGISECPDCQVATVEALPPHPANERPLRLMELHRGASVDIRILEAALREKGIPSLVRPVEPLMGVIGDLLPSPFAQLLISADDYEEYRSVIDDCLRFVGIEHDSA